MTKDVRAAKDWQTRNEASQRRIAGMQQLVEPCTELQEYIDMKTEKIEQLEAELDLDIRKLNDLTKVWDPIENEMPKFAL